MQVVIGGGLASIKVQNLLAQSPGFRSDFSVTVVQPHDFYECPITQPSCFLKPEQHGQRPCAFPLEQVPPAAAARARATSADYMYE